MNNFCCEYFVGFHAIEANINFVSCNRLVLHSVNVHMPSLCKKTMSKEYTGFNYMKLDKEY